MFLKSLPERDEAGNGLALCRQSPRSNLVHDALCTLKRHETYPDNSLASRYSPVELVRRIIVGGIPPGSSRLQLVVFQRRSKPGWLAPDPALCAHFSRGREKCELAVTTSLTCVPG